MFGCRMGYKDVTWYPHEKNYLGTIVDEHYYRSNEYLLKNADRYNYYYRPYQNGELLEDQVSKYYAEDDGLKKAVIDGKLEAYNRDVYHSVTKDESSVYMKLVNADNFEKRVKVSLS